MPDDERRKIALFTNVQPEAVISALDADSHLQDPGHAARPDARRDRLPQAGHPGQGAPTCRSGSLVDALEHPQHEVDIAFVGKYVDLTESYKSLTEALVHAGIHTAARSTSTTSTPSGRERRHRRAGEDGRHPGPRRLRQARHRRQDRGDPLCAREQVPYLGICLGMQLATIEFARHVAGLEGANSTEFDADTPHPVVALITEWQEDREGASKSATPVPTSAAPCAWAPSAARSSPAPWRARSTAPRSTSGTAIATRSTTPTCRSWKPPAW
jgi:CTP synthase